jgi:hypothetical protein
MTPPSLKFDPSGKLLAATYVGGSMGDAPDGLSVSADGEVLYVGETLSTDFPVSANAFQSAHGGGGHDFFVVRLSSDLTKRWSTATYLGGSAHDNARGSLFGDDCALYVVGASDGGFPVKNAWQPVYGGGVDQWGNGDNVVAKFTPGWSVAALDRATSFPEDLRRRLLSPLQVLEEVIEPIEADSSGRLGSGLHVSGSMPLDAGLDLNGVIGGLLGDLAEEEGLAVLEVQQRLAGREQPREQLADVLHVRGLGDGRVDHPLELGPQRGARVVDRHLEPAVVLDHLPLVEFVVPAPLGGRGDEVAALRPIRGLGAYSLKSRALFGVFGLVRSVISPRARVGADFKPPTSCSTAASSQSSCFVGSGDSLRANTGVSGAFGRLRTSPHPVWNSKPSARWTPIPPPLCAATNESRSGSADSPRTTASATASACAS